MVAANPKFTQGLRGRVPPKLPEFPEMSGLEGDGYVQGAGSEPASSSRWRRSAAAASASSPASSSSSGSPRCEAPPLLSSAEAYAAGAAAPALPRLPRRLGTDSDAEELDDSPFGLQAASARGSSARGSVGPPSSRQSLRPSLRRAITVVNSVVPQDEGGGAGAWRREELGDLPTVGGAAQARRARAACSQLEERIRFQRLERSELCTEGRAAVRNWALGHISGPQCLLRLELCPSVAKLLGKELPEPPPPGEEGAPQDEDPEVERVALWAVGCVRLGGSDPRLEVLRQELEERAPPEVLKEAYAVVEKECGAEGGDHMDANEINWDWAFQRIAMRTSRSRASDPGAFVRLQVRREVLRVHLGVSDAEDLDEDDASQSQQPWSRFRQVNSGGTDLDDASILDWLQRTQEQVRERARELSPEALAREADRMLSYVTQTIQMAACLREALEGLQRFDAYKIIGVRRGASRSEVRRAFYKKALLVHPDKGGDKAAFQELQRAYDEILRELDGKGEEEEEDEAEAEAEEEDSEEEEEVRRRRRRSQQQSEEGQEDGEQEATEGAAAAAAGGAPPAEEELSKGRLGWFARAALDAAEGAGECATECLRHCRAARDALEDEPPDWDTGCENAEVALAAAEAVVEAGRLVAGLTGKVSAALEDALETLQPQSADLPEAEPAHVTTLRHASTSTSEASKAVELSVELCSQAAAEASAAAEGPFFGGSAAADRLSDAVDELARAAKQLAVAALDAAEAAAEAARSCKGLMDDLPNQDARGVDEEGEEEAEAGEGVGTTPEEAEEEKQSQAPPEPTEAEREAKRLKAAEAQRLLRSHQSLSTLLEAVRMLGCTNKELLKLQRSAQTLTFQRAGRLPSVLQLRGLRAMQLLAEFLDEAALAFYAVLLDLWQAVPGRQRSARAFEDVVIRAVESSFAFILKSSPDLAVPLDPRAQTLRVALALDPTAASEMVLMQASQRLQASVMSVILEAAGTESSDAEEDQEEEDSGDLHGAGRVAIHRMERMLRQALAALEQLGADRDPKPTGRATCERQRSV